MRKEREAESGHEAGNTKYLWEKYLRLRMTSSSHPQNREYKVLMGKVSLPQNDVITSASRHLFHCFLLLQYKAKFSLSPPLHTPRQLSRNLICFKQTIFIVERRRGKYTFVVWHLIFSLNRRTFILVKSLVQYLTDSRC